MSDRTLVAEAASRPLDREQFADYARRQIGAAGQLLAQHEIIEGGYGCACGRPTPCPQRQSLIASREHFEGKLALLDSTVLLPIVAPDLVTAVSGRRLRHPLDLIRDKWSVILTLTRS